MLRRLVRGIVAAAAIGLAVAGLPLLLSATIGNPAPGWSDLAVGDVSDTAVLALLATLAWIAWGSFTVSVAVEVVHLLGQVVRHRRVPVVRPGLALPETVLPGGRLVRALLGAVVAALPLAGSAPAFALTPPVSAVVLRSASAAPGHPGAVTRRAAPPSPRSLSGTTPPPHKASGDPVTRVDPVYPVYTVRPGDQLGAIAQRFLGAASQYPQIRAANPELMPTLRGPEGADHIYPGWQLRLPAPARDRGPVRHASGRLRNRAGTGPSGRSPESRRPNGGATTATPGPGAPTGSTTGRHLRSVPSATGRSPAAGPGTSTVPPTRRPVAARGGRGSIPHGWFDLLAGALAAAAGLIWLGRRRRRGAEEDAYVGAPGADPAGLLDRSLLEDEEFDERPVVTPSAANLARLRHVVQEHAAHLTLVTHPQHDASPVHDPASWNPLPAWIDTEAEEDEALVARTSRHQAGSDVPGSASISIQPVEDREDGPGTTPTRWDLGIELPAHPLALCGAGALAAGRALLIDILTAPSPGPGVVLSTANLIQDLLPGWVPTRTDLQTEDNADAADRLVISDDGSQALILAERETEGRLALVSSDPDAHLFTESVPSHSAASRTDSTPVVLITEIPPARVFPRLTQLAQRGASVGVHVVMLDQNPDALFPGPTVSVELGGHVSDAELDGWPDRIPVLDEGTAISRLSGERALTMSGGLASPAQTDSSSWPRDAGHEREPVHVIGDRSNGSASRATLTDPTQAPDLNGNERSDDQNLSASVATDPRSDDTEPGEQEPHPPASPQPPTEPATHKVLVTVLGEPTVLDPHSGKAPRSLRRHAKELLVYLAVHRHGAQRSDILEAIWPEASLTRAQERFSTEASNVRRSIRDLAGDPGLQPLVNTDGRYHLAPDVVDVDLWSFLDALDAASATSDPQTRLQRLQAALSIPAGQLAEDSGYEWIEGPREQVRQQRIRTMLALSEQPDADADLTARLVSEAADLAPTSEDLARRAFRALAAVGDPDGVRQRSERLRRALDEIGERPSEETASLARTAEVEAATRR